MTSSRALQIYSFLLATIAASLLPVGTFAQGLNCAGGRIIYAKKYTELYSEYTGTAVVVEGCSAACEGGAPENREGCFIAACGLACLFIGLDNCFQYYNRKLEIDSFRKGIEGICLADEERQRAVALEKDEVAWSLALAQDSIEGFQTYLDGCQDVCEFRSNAERQIRFGRIKEDAENWRAARSTGTQQALKDYLAQCGDTCQYRKVAEIELEQIEQARREHQAEMIGTYAKIVVSTPLQILLTVGLQLGGTLTAPVIMLAVLTDS